MTLYKNRTDAGCQLAQALIGYQNHPDLLVLALPRGGVPIAYEVAQTLNAPLDIFMVRKIGVPGREELAMGAIASGGVRVLNVAVLQALAIPEHILEAVTEKERLELERREHVYRDSRSAPSIRDRIIILIDDGLATGATMRAAIAALRLQEPARIVVAVPVAAESTCRNLTTLVDEVVCIATPEPFYGVGLWYDDFSPTTDEEVGNLLRQVEPHTTTTKQ